MVSRKIEFRSFVNCSKFQIMKTFIYFILFCFGFTSFAQELSVELVASGFSFPVNIAHANDDRLFITEQTGKIKIVQANHQVENTPFLDISNLTVAQGERGLLGLAFSPNYSENGEFYVNYTNLQGNTIIARYTVSPDPNIANPDGEIILEINQPFTNHNGGHIKFGADNYLYISMGDGGSGGDPQNNGQNINSLLGKMLRIDVDAETYINPSDNPFIGADGSDEIWAYGLRNAWRFSFDSVENEVWIADVGQNALEEINRQPSNLAGLNYGWRCYEGDNPYNTNGCDSASSMVFPVATYGHTNGRCSVTGGNVYRGSEFPNLQGKYIFADYCGQEIGIIHQNNTLEWVLDVPGVFFTGFGENYENELYAVGSSILYKIIGQNLSVNDETRNEIKVYPNPTSDFIKIIGLESIKEVLVFDLHGKLIQKLNDFSDHQLNVQNLPAGMYIIQAQTNKLTYSFKLMKK